MERSFEQVRDRYSKLISAIQIPILCGAVIGGTDTATTLATYRYDGTDTDIDTQTSLPQYE